jgi:hypothetical protein
MELLTRNVFLLVQVFLNIGRDVFDPSPKILVSAEGSSWIQSRLIRYRKALVAASVFANETSDLCRQETPRHD